MKGWSKIMNNEFNTKMQQLYELLCDINATAPSKNLNTAYENLFSSVNDCIEQFNNIGTEDSIVPELHDVEIIVTTEGSEDDYNQMLDNMNTKYTEFMQNKECYTVSKTPTDNDKLDITAHFYGLWSGDRTYCARLTRHAEGFYENTKLEYVHVEVCIDGKWFGKNK